jgi:uncharacterized membrane protein (UPF0127 family)
MARPASLRAVNVTRGRVLAVSVEDANGLWGKFMGLMGRPSLADDAGLWLPESNGIHMMFMRFPIDALFLSRPDPAQDGARTVLRASERLPAWRGLVPLVRGAHGVLELPAGAIAGSGTQIGDTIRLEPLGE